MMKSLIATLTSFALFTSPLLAQENQEAAPPAPPKENSLDWKSWTFGGITFVTATIGMLLVCFDKGAKAPADQRP
jgi:hypothetical protein